MRHTSNLTQGSVEYIEKEKAAGKKLEQRGPSMPGLWPSYSACLRSLQKTARLGLYIIYAVGREIQRTSEGA
jgi:hypothetical protein